jgi:hypothetical protein
MREGKRMTLELAEPVDLVRRVVELLVERGDREEAAAHLARLDQDALWSDSREARRATRGLPREPSRQPHRIGRTDALAVHERNQFTCRFSRCGFTPTIDEDVLKTLGKLGVLEYYRAQPRGWHPLAWTYQTAADHLVPRSSDPADWTTACWTCNAAKSSIALETLGWDHDPRPPAHTWHGLREHLPALTRLHQRDAGRTGRSGEAAPASPAVTGRERPPADATTRGSEKVVDRSEALARCNADRWTARSFHPSSDGGSRASLVVAARIEGAAAPLLTSRGALKTYTVTRSGPYVSIDGRWRTRMVEPTDSLAASAGWSARTPWVLERYRENDGGS